MGKLGGNQNEPKHSKKKDATIENVDRTLDHMDGAMAQASALDGASNAASGPTAKLENEVQTLVWALVDEYIDEPGLRRLEALVLQSAEARTTYVRCIQLHVDLIYYFAQERRKNDPNAPDLPFPLPAELQKMLDASKSSPQNTKPAQCSARRPQPSMLRRWWSELNRRLDQVALAFRWQMQAAFNRI